jgi:hypothetical protein
MAGRPVAYVARGSWPPACVDARDRTPNRGGGSSEGREPQESTDGRSQPGQVLGSSLNGLPGGAKLRSGRTGDSPASPAQVGSARHVRRTPVRRGDRASGREERPSRLHASRVHLRVGSSGKELARNGKAIVNLPRALRRRRSESEPARKQKARESGHGSPGRESSGGELQGRERHGTRPQSVGGHGERRSPKDFVRAASRPEPSRGARTLRTAPTRVWRSSSRTVDREEDRDGQGAPDVVVFEGARTSREADPQGPDAVRFLLEGAGPAERTSGRRT